MHLVSLCPSPLECKLHFGLLLACPCHIPRASARARRTVDAQYMCMECDSWATSLLVPVAEAKNRV